MKTLFIPLIAALTLAASCSSENAEVKKDFINTCASSAKEGFGGTVKESLINDYCECSYNKLTGSLTESELKQLDAPDAALKAKSEALTKPCLDEFVSKASTSSQSGQ
ncbi:MAG: hypothetical protein EOP52_12870 [Sphingobacteriales bacterium]|nr:MAG: hypothetical protein EOP52_12870 [Sphingobacteriales bacterium]